MSEIFRAARRWWPSVMLLAWLAAAAANAAEGLTLDQALALAVEEAPVLHAEAARVEAARQAVGPADALPDPTLMLGVDNLPVEDADRYSLSGERMTMQRIGVMQRFPNGAKRRARAVAAERTLSVAEAEAQAARQAVMRQTASAWIRNATVARQLTLLDELFKQNRLLDQAVQARVAGGEGRAEELVAPRREAAEIAARQDTLLAAKRQAEAQLARWIGKAALQPPAGVLPSWPISPEMLLKSLHYHPELAAISRRAAVFEAEADEARAAKRPDWALTVAYLKRDDEFDDMAMLQLDVDLPLFSGSRQGPRIASAEAAHRAAQAEAEALRREHEAMLVADLAEYERLEKAVTRQREIMLPLASEKVSLVTAAWRGGQGSLAEVIAARSEHIDAELTAIQLEGMRARLAAQLHFTHDHQAMMEAIGDER